MFAKNKGDTGKRTVSAVRTAARMVHSATTLLLLRDQLEKTLFAAIKGEFKFS
jgi:hypothetical protein